MGPRANTSVHTISSTTDFHELGAILRLYLPFNDGLLMLPLLRKGYFHIGEREPSTILHLCDSTVTRHLRPLLPQKCLSLAWTVEVASIGGDEEEEEIVAISKI
jgi:hypothetical protein